MLKIEDNDILTMELPQEGNDISTIELPQEGKSDILAFDLPKGQSSIIKVIGVGGGGNNAVDHMYRLGIIGVDFINCNTDRQVLEASPVPNVIRFGKLGTGAGNNPEKGRQLAEENADEIRSLLKKNTEMVFITAGMGGGTGTGAAPVIAAIARSLDILTVGIVTEPFAIEGKRRQEQARQGIKEMKKYVDVLLVISNDRLREQYGDLKLTEAFQRADDVLANAAKGIAEIITVRGYVNVDLEDVKTVMRNSGTAIMGMGVAKGEDRATQVVEEALNSPLLNNIDIRGSKNLLLYITYGSNEVSMDEMGEITELVHERTGNNADLILGHGHDERLGEHIAVSIIATGFKTPGEKVEPVTQIPDYTQQKEPIQQEKVVMPLNEAAPSSASPIPEAMILPEEKKMTEESTEMHLVVKESPLQLPQRGREDCGEEMSKEEENLTLLRSYDLPVSSEKEVKEEGNLTLLRSYDLPVSQEPMKIIVVEDYDEEDENTYVSEKPIFATNYQPETSPVATRQAPETSVYPQQDYSPINDLDKSRKDQFRNFSVRAKTQELSNDIEEPAFRRRNVQFEPADHSSESHVSKYQLFPSEDGKVVYHQNPYLHDNVD
ncbi:MAG: cell division protein FtsZ [Bacteroidales bacterium]|nr:cell division protein FtsZ [Bacteroidales bacterium]